MWLGVELIAIMSTSRKRKRLSVSQLSDGEQNDYPRLQHGDFIWLVHVLGYNRPDQLPLTSLIIAPSVWRY